MNVRIRVKVAIRTRRALRWIGRHSVRRQLIAGVAIVHFLLMSIFVIDLTYRQRRFLNDRARTRVHFQTGLLATSSLSYVIVDDLAGLGEVVDDFARDQTVHYAMVTDLHGRILSDSDHHKDGKYLDDAASASVLNGPAEPRTLYVSPSSLQAVAPITIHGHHIGWAWVGINRSGDERHLQYVTQAGVIYTLLAMLIGTAFAIVLAAAVTRPLRLLEAGADRLSHDHLDEPVPVTTRNEVGVVTIAFNTAMQRLASQRSELRSARDELEKRVEERTKELAQANAILAEQIRERAEAQEALRQAHAELEDRVKERTAELAQSNQALQTEITERRRAEEALKQANAALARSNEDLEQFAYAASHDLQEPLRTIRSFIAMLAKRYKEKLGGEALEFIDYVIGGADRMQALINDLLGYSRIGRSEEPLSIVSCDDALQTVLSNLHGAIESSGAVIASAPLPRIVANKMEMVQLFQNLVGNAIKYRSERTPQIAIRASRQGEEWIFEICDNGIGILPRHQKRIFGVFQRLHGDEYPGTGIGLATCSKIVQRHGGRIWVESEFGVGSAFKFTIHNSSPGFDATRIDGTESRNVQV